MRIKVSDTWRAKVEVELAGDDPSEPVRGHFTAEFKEMAISRLKAFNKERRRRQRDLADLRRAEHPDRDAIARLEDQVANADRELLDEVLVRVHGLELEKPDGELMTQSELLDYVKDHAEFAIPITRAFSDKIAGLAEKNSKRSGKR